MKTTKELWIGCKFCKKQIKLYATHQGYPSIDIFGLSSCEDDILDFLQQHDCEIPWERRIAAPYYAGIGYELVFEVDGKPIL